MISSRSLLNYAVSFHTYIWVDVLLVKETTKAILIMFDGRRIWLPRAWIKRIKQSACPPKPSAKTAWRKRKAISIKISEYHWAKKF